MAYKPEHFNVWMEIPVTDMDRAITYYNEVCDAGLTLDMSGPNPMAMFRPANDKSGVSGHLYPGKPAAKGTGPTIHLAVPGKLEDALERATKAGGEVVSGPIPVPDGRFAYTLDPDGNSVGLFERD